MASTKNSILMLILIALFGSVGCASTPLATSLPEIVREPDRFKNKHIAITAPVLENRPPAGDNYRTWSFTLGGDAPHQITATEEGFNPATIDRAYLLVDDAMKAGDPVTITGRLRLGPYKALEQGMAIELGSVTYGGVRIGTDKGPFVGRSYPPFRGSIFFGFSHSSHHH